MASILKVDEMQGVTSAGNITITSEGGSATQSLQQGVCKLWGQSTASGDEVTDSLNCSSMVDAGTGQQNWNFANNMSSDDYAAVISPLGNNVSEPFIQSFSTSGFQGYMYDEGGGAGSDIAQAITVHGDLA